MTVSQGQYSEMQRALDDLRAKSKEEAEKLQAELQDARECGREKEAELEQSLREKDEELKSMRNMFEKEKAIFDQKAEFKEVQCA